MAHHAEFMYIVTHVQPELPNVNLFFLLYVSVYFPLCHLCAHISCVKIIYSSEIHLMQIQLVTIMYLHH